jgi:N-acetyl-1-D-myo-inositol-2-amino-2-deoxy-alpha-D-glucopyranoside deacetylase
VSGPGLLAVHAHPDDETLANGGLLATWADAGLPVTVVTCTRGEQGEVIPARLAHLAGDGAALGAHREGELAAAMAALGVGDHLFLDEVVKGAGADPGAPRLADSGMAWVEDGRAGAVARLPDDAFVGVQVEEAAALLATVLRERRPEVVVGYEPGGGYGHPDHVQAHRVMERAVDLLDPAEAPTVLWTVVDQDALRRARALLPAVPGGVRRAGPDDPVPSAAVPTDSVDLRVDLAPVLDRVLGALRAHETQVRLLDVPVDGSEVVGAFTLSNDVAQPLLRHECYRLSPRRPRREPGAWPAGVRAQVA